MVNYKLGNVKYNDPKQHRLIDWLPGYLKGLPWLKTLNEPESEYEFCFMTSLNEFDKRIRMCVYFLSEFEPDKRIFGFEFGFGFEIRLVVSEFPPLNYYLGM